jgi:hypothetical protein
VRASTHTDRGIPLFITFGTCMYKKSTKISSRYLAQNRLKIYFIKGPVIIYGRGGEGKIRGGHMYK